MCIKQLKESQIEYKEEEVNCLYRINNPETDPIQKKFDIDSLWYDNEIFILNSFFIEKNISAMKKYCYTCGLLDEYDIYKYESRILTYGISNIAYAILSDNQEFIKRYAYFSLEYDWYQFNIKKGSILHAMQLSIINELTHDYVDLIEQLSKKKGRATLKIDTRFFRALIEKDKVGIESAIYDLLLPKNHRYRNKNMPLINKFISHPALGYAKLAWLKGIEVEIENPLIPKELLPIAPLDNYEIPYDFLKNEIS